MENQPPSWEPKTSQMGNWTSLFEEGRGRRPEAGPSIGGAPVAAGPDAEPAEESLDLDVTDYKPWVLQRGRSRPAMMLHLRRYEPKSGFWMSWQLSYPHLIAAEYVGDRMLSLDFGTRQFVIEGKGLDKLAQYLQVGQVLLLQEHSQEIWPNVEQSSAIIRIRQIQGGVAPMDQSSNHLHP